MKFVSNTNTNIARLSPAGLTKTSFFFAYSEEAFRLKVIRRDKSSYANKYRLSLRKKKSLEILYTYGFNFSRVKRCTLKTYFFRFVLFFVFFFVYCYVISIYYKFKKIYLYVVLI